MASPAANDATLCCWLLSFLLASGCGSGDGIERVQLTGDITFQGEKLPVGQIRFIPLQGTPGPLTVERFENGRYATTTSGGVPVGQHRVEIQAYTAEDFENWPVGPGAPPIPQILPPQFNRSSTLTVTLESGTRRTVQDFHLK